MASEHLGSPVLTSWWWDCRSALPQASSNFTLGQKALYTLVPWLCIFFFFNLKAMAQSDNSNNVFGGYNICISEAEDARGLRGTGEELGPLSHSPL